MSVKFLKNDWKGKGKFKAIADWMNAISNQFNGATVPSGGTAQPTKLGFQIEVDNDGGPYHFEVIPYPTGAGIEVEVRGGWWAYYEAEARTQVDLEVAGVSYDDTTGALSTVTGAGVVYLELDTDAGTLEADYVTTAGWAALTDTADIYRKKIAEITWDAVNSVIDEIRQDWRGGNILCDLGGGDSENDHSFHYRGDGNMTVGGYRLGDSNNSVIPTPTASNYKTITPVVSQAYWIEVDWTTSTATNFNPDVTFQQGATFPTGVSGIWVYPLIEFDANGVCIERQQGNIQLPDARIPAPSGSNGGALVYTGGDISWVYAETDHTYVGRKTDNSIDFDYPRWNGGTP